MSHASQLRGIADSPLVVATAVGTEPTCLCQSMTSGVQGIADERSDHAARLGRPGWNWSSRVSARSQALCTRSSPSSSEPVRP
jgi:hypothetical protein